MELFLVNYTPVDKALSVKMLQISNVEVNMV